MIVLQLPANIDMADPSKAIRQLWDYLLSFQEQITVILRNLDAENFTDTGLREIADMFSADTIISNTTITQEIYSSYGNIANLTVYKLRTDYEKAQKYLNGDTSDVDYISIHDETISFITAKVSAQGGITQLVDGSESFYWTDETFSQMTSEKTTDYPVMIYDYSEMVKANISFRTIALPDNGSTVMPVFTLGAGTGSGDNGKGFLYKGMDGLYLDYHSSIDGSLRRIMLSDSGIIISPYELKTLDFYSNGFRAAYDGETVAMTWTLDSGGRITKLTTADNAEIPVTWHEGAM